MLSSGPNVAKYAFEGGPAETVASLNRGLVNIGDLTQAIGNVENAENVVQVLGALTGASISFAKIHDTTIPDLYNSAKKIDVNESSGGGGSSSGGKPPKGDKSSEHMLGSKGAQVSSKTTWQKGRTERIDVENPAPGERPGQIHYHDSNNNKYYYDINNNIFYNQKTGELAPKGIQKMLNDKDFMRGIKKALEILGE